jgi:hypothetical protein
MNIATESNITGKPANLEGKPLNEPPKKRPAKLLRWSIIVGLGLVLIVGAIDIEGPDPLVSNIGKTAGAFPIPVAIVPEHLSDEELDALS